MTLVIGIKCRNGIVMGADGGATLGDVPHATVMQPTKKLEIISEAVIIGVSGHVGLGQQFRGAIDNLWQNKKLAGKESVEAAKILSEDLWKCAEPEWKKARLIAPLDPQAAQIGVSFQIAIALPVSGEPCLFQFDRKCSPEEATEHLLFFAIGSAQATAETFLAFIRQVLWKENTIPSLADGRFAAFWTLEHCIRISPGGISGPKQIVTLEKTKKTWRARELSDHEITDHSYMVEELEKHIAKYKQPEEKEIPIPEPH